jgi:hypothetical protein
VSLHTVEECRSRTRLTRLPAVARRDGWEASRAAAVDKLRDGESIVALFPALTPPDDGGSGLVPALLIPLIAAVESWHWRHTARKLARQSLFPLAPRMVVALTERRLLVWTAGRRWSLGPFIGFVTMDRIVQAEVVTVGSGWRTVRFDLANEPSVRLKVPGELADDLADFLSGRPLATDDE